jgi:hypothetical protein
MEYREQFEYETGIKLLEAYELHKPLFAYIKWLESKLTSPNGKYEECSICKRNSFPTIDKALKSNSASLQKGLTSKKA